MEGHKIPSAEELKNKKYCKWHHFYTHYTANCVAFRLAIQKTSKERRFNLADKGAIEMTVNTYPFQKLDINMVSFSGYRSPQKPWKQSVR